MKRTREHPAENDAELEMTPMIDVTFLLLVFFMCTLKFKTLEGKLAAYLPKDVGVSFPAADPREDVEVQLRVLAPGSKLDVEGGPYTGTGRWKYDDTRVIEYSLGPKRTTDVGAVARQLAALHSKDVERPASIDARAGIVYAEVVEVLDAALAAGFQEITFVGAYR